MRYNVQGLKKLVLFLGVLFLAGRSQAEEGMWEYTNLPRAQLKASYGFDPSQGWLDHLMKSSVRFNSGGSGSFISSTGLVLTNHHVGADTLAKISTPQHDYYKMGYLAHSYAEEIPAPDLELNQLVSIDDVTAQVLGAVKPGMTPAEEFAAKQAMIAQIQKDSLNKTGLRSDVVTLYLGAQYHLYRYKKYTDVRLVFAPEFAIAFFGGDPDNFEYPRFDLDMCIFRVYENGQPAKIQDFLRWSNLGTKENELIFVSGHPGRTNRLYTYDALKFYKEARLPLSLEMLRSREKMLLKFSSVSPEFARQAKSDLFYVQNSRKALNGQLGGLNQPEILAQKQADEKTLRDQVAANPKLKEATQAWDQISQAEKEHGKVLVEKTLFENMAGIYSQTFSIARNLVRMVAEDQKPNSERLPEFSDSNRASLEMQIYSNAPIYKDLEIAKLTQSFSLMVKKLGRRHGLVKQVLAGRSILAAAKYYVNGTKLFDVAERKALSKGGTRSIDASKDTMVQLARLVDPLSRQLRKTFEDKVDGPEQIAYRSIAQAIFAIKGTTTYPDATFTLRLAYGTVKGYQQDGKQIPALTTLGGAFDHEAEKGGVDPFLLPDSWHQHKKDLNLSTPFNFVSTADIIGGNSGSPVVDRNGDLVGLIFDGNIQSLLANYLYSDVQSRAVSVHSSAIRETMDKIYGAQSLTAELGK